MSLSIIIVTYNNAADIGPCLSAVQHATKGIQSEVILVDNCSSDSTLDVAKRYENVAIYSTGENRGFARAVNAGAALARHRYLLLLNPDAVVDAACIGELLAYAEANPDRLPLGGRSFYRDGRVDPRTCWGLPTLWSTFCFASGMSTWLSGRELFDPESMGRWERDDDREVGVVTGYLLLFPTRMWRQLGGLDSRFFMYGEDTDFSLRAKEAGFRPGILPSATLVHEAGASSTASGKLLLVMRGKSTYMRKHWGKWRGTLGVILLQLGVGIRAFAEGVAGDEPHWRIGWSARRSWRSGYPPYEQVDPPLMAVAGA